MKRIILLAIALMLFSSAIYAEQVWPQPLTLFSARNIDFAGQGIKTTSGNYLISWKDTLQPELKQQFRLIDEQGNGLWQISIPLLISHTNAELRWILETDGDFLLLFAYGDGFLQGYRINSFGEHVWPEEGIQLTHANLIKPQTPAKLIADGNGGFFNILAWAFDGIANPTNYYFQHIDAEGNTAIIDGPSSYEFIPISDAVLAGKPDLFALAEGGIICAYRENNTVKIRRMLSNHTFSWTHTLDADSAVWPSLIDIGAGSFILIWHTTDSIKAMRYGYDFSAQWIQPIDIGGNNLGLEAENCQTVKCSDGKILCVWKSGNEIWGQRFDDSGTLECGPNGMPIMVELMEDSSFQLLPDNQGGCFVSMNSATSGITQAQYIDAQNQILPQPIIIAQSSPSQLVGHEVSSAAFASGLHCYYQNHEAGLSGILLQGMDSSGNLSYPDNPISIVSGSCGTAYSPHSVAESGKIFSTWLQNPASQLESNSLFQICYQWINPDGTIALAENGTVFSPDALMPILDLQAFPTGRGATLLCWVENTIPAKLKAQLINSSGIQLWEPGGKTICENGLQNLTSESYYILTQAHDAVYIIWLQDSGVSSKQIRAQKIGMNQTLWETGGRTIVSENGANLRLLAADQDYLIYGHRNAKHVVNSDARLYRFNAAGAMQAGFEDLWWHTNIIINGCKAGTDRIYVLYTLAEWQIEWYNFYPYGQAFSSTGQRLWGQNGIADISGNLLFTDANNLYVIRANTLYKYNSMGQQQFNFIVPTIPAGASNLDVYQLEKSWENRFVGLGQHAAYLGGTDLFYFCFDSTGWNSLDIDYLLSIGSPLNDSSLCRLYNDVYVIWGTSATFLDPGLRHIQLQRINSHLVENDDPVAPSLQGAILTPGYPNPFSHEYRFSTTVPQKAAAKIAIYNLRGQIVRHLYTGTLEQGKTDFEWDGLDDSGSTVANGMYLCQAKLGEYTRTIRMVKLRK